MDQPLALMSRTSASLKSLKYLSAPDGDQSWLLMGSADGAIGLLDLKSKSLAGEFVGNVTDCLGGADGIVHGDASLNLVTGGRLGLVREYPWA